MGSTYEFSSHCTVIFFFSSTQYKIVLLQHPGCPDMPSVRQDSLSSTEVLYSIRNVASQAVTDMPAFSSQCGKGRSSPTRQCRGLCGTPLGSWTWHGARMARTPRGCWWQQKPPVPPEMTFLDSSPAPQHQQGVIGCPGKALTRQSHFFQPSQMN